MSASSAESHALLRQALCRLRPVLERVSRSIHARPELCYEERFAVETLAGELTLAHIAVERGTGGVETALSAELGAGGATVAILAEYDALPELGHACGHNLIAAGALGAFLALHALGDRRPPGRVRLIGTPAEEGGGGKIRLLDAGVFADVDAALMFHPLDRTLLCQPHLELVEVRVQYDGESAHAGTPWRGRSALTGVLQLFGAIDAARLRLRDGTRIHGVITDGGKAANVIPAYAEARFMMRAPDGERLDAAIAAFRQAADAAALSSGTTVALAWGPRYRDLRKNGVLLARFARHLDRLGVPYAESDPTLGSGSTDMGNVSHAVPSIHPTFAVGPRGTLPHSAPFADVAASAAAFDATLLAAEAMAATALDLLAEPALLASAKAEHASCYAAGP